MNVSTFNRSCALAVVLASVSAMPVWPGDPEPLPPVFVPPPTGGVVDPVFVPERPETAKRPGRASSDATASIVAEIDAARRFCQSMPAEEYIIDCLGDALQTIASGISPSGDYAEARAVLGDTAQKLRALARSNASRELPTGRVRVPTASGRGSASPLTPVARETLPQTNAAAVAILEEAETVLLRSAANSEARKVHYQQIAAAVGSNKVLLRSA